MPWQRKGRRIAYVLVAFAALFLLAHTPPARSVALRVVNRLAPAGWLVGGIDYRLWRGEIRAFGVRFASDPERPAIAMTARSLFAKFSLSADPLIRVESPEFRLQLAGGDGGPLSLPPALLAARLEMEDGRFLLFQSGDTVPIVELDDVHAELARDGGRSRGTVDVPRGLVRRREVEIPFGPARARVLLGTNTVELDVEHRLDVSQARGVAPELALTGVLEGDARVRLDAGSRWIAEGVVRSSSLALPRVGAVVLEAPWRFEDGVVRIDGGSVEGLDGKAIVDAEIDIAAGTEKVEASFEGLDVSKLSTLVASRASGSMELSSAGWSFDSAIGTANLSLRPEVSRSGLPLRGEARVRLTGRRLTFEAPRLRADSLEISVSGSLADSLDARFSAVATDFAETVRLLGARLPRLSGAGAGPITIDGTLTGPIAAPEVRAHLSSDDLSLDRASFALDGDVILRGSRLHLDGITLRQDEGALLLLDGHVPLTPAAGAWELTASAEGVDLARFVRWPVAGIANGSLHIGGPSRSLEAQGAVEIEGVSIRGVSLPNVALDLEADPGLARVRARFADGREILTGRVALASPYLLEARIALASLPFAELRPVFPELEEAGARLEMSGRADLEVPLLKPEDLRYRIEAEQVLGSYRGIVLGTTTPFSIEGDRTLLEVRGLTLVGEDTALDVEGVVPLSRDGGVALNARGATRLELLSPWFPDTALAGRANVDVAIEGALPDPWLRGDLTLDDARARLGGILFENLSLRADLAEETSSMVVEASALSGRLRARADLLGRLGPRAAARVAIEAEDIDPLLLREPDPRWAGTEMRVSFQGDLEGEGLDPARWRGGGTATKVLARRDSLTVSNESPAPWTLEGGTVVLRELAMSDGTTRLVLDGEARPFDEPFAFSAHAAGRIDHSVSSVILADLGWNFTGVSDVDLRVGGGDRPFFIQGRGSFEGARLVVRDPPIAFTRVAGEIELQDGTIKLERLTADAGGGTVDADGRIVLSEARVAEVDLSARARSVRIEYPEGLRSEIDGDFRLQGDGDALRLSGEASLARAVFSRDISVESELLRSLSHASTLDTSGRFSNRVRLDVRVRSVESVRVDNNLARMEVTANLTAGGTLAAPEIGGIASARSGGRFQFAGNTYRIEAGRILLRDYPRSPPELDITARTSVSGHDIRLVLSGTTDNLSTELVAPGDPDLTRADVAALLLTGRTLDKVSSEGRAIVEERMASYLGSSLADLAELGLGSALPFDVVTVEPALIAGEADPGARFTLGARFNDSLSVVYSIGLNNPEDQIWIVDYELPRRLRTQLIRDQFNEFTLGVSQEARFDLGGSKSVEAPKVRVESVAVSGAVCPEIRSRLRTKAGDRYDYWKAWDDAEELREELRKRGYLESTVDVAARSAGADRVALDYTVEVGPGVRFVFEGDEPDSDLKRALADAWNGLSGEAFLTADLTALAEGKLYQERYYNARAQVTSERSEAEVVVTVNIARGPRGKRIVVDFQGNEVLSDATLLRLLPAASSAEFHELVTAKRTRLEQLLLSRYASEGFVSAEVSEPELSYDSTDGTLRVRIPVEEGALFHLDRIELSGIESLDQGEIRSRLSLQEGAPFRATSFARDRAALASLYRDRGFPDVEVEALVVPGTEGTSLGARFVVREGPKVTVGNVAVEGNDKTREGVIRNALALDTGQPLSQSAVRETQKRLYELGVFQSAEVVVDEPGADSSRRDVRIEVNEAPDLEVEYGLRGSTDGSFQVLGELRALNLFGRAQNVALRALVGSDQRIFRFAYHSPYLSRHRLDTNFFLERDFRFEGPELIEETGQETFPFTDRTWTFTAQQNRPIREELNLQWSYSFKRVVTEIDDPLDFFDAVASQVRSILTGAVIGDYRDSVVDPSRGSLWNVTFQAAPKSLGSDLTFTKLYGQLYTYWTLPRGIVWAGGYRLGLANAFDQRLTLEDGFRAGGPSSVRAFEQDSLGPVDELGPKGGAGLVVINQELRFPFHRRVQGVSFYDVGNAFDKASDIRLSELRHAAGVGLRLRLPFGFLRFDLARVIDLQEGEEPWRFVFSLGHAF
jgi:outer membrane protein insertion porin family